MSHWGFHILLIGVHIYYYRFQASFDIWKVSPPSLFLIWMLLLIWWNSLVLSGKELACQWRRLGFNPSVGKIWRRKWLPAAVFFPGKPRGAWQATPMRLQKSWMQLSDWASLVAQLVKNLPVMWETWVRSLGWEDPLEEGTATHSSILAWRIPQTVYSPGVAKSRTRLSDFQFHFSD